MRNLIDSSFLLVEGFLTAVANQKCDYCLYAQKERLNLSEENAKLVQTTCDYHSTLEEFAGNPTDLALQDGIAQLTIQNFNPQGSLSLLSFLPSFLPSLSPVNNFHET